MGVGHPSRKSANDWELFKFVVLLRTFGHYLANKTMVVDCDNACSVSAIKKFRARSAKAEYCCDTRQCRRGYQCTGYGLVHGRLTICLRVLSRVEYSLILHRYVGILFLSALLIVCALVILS